MATLEQKKSHFQENHIQLKSNFHYFFHVLFLRTREDEVHVPARCSDSQMEPVYNEAGPVPGSYSGEQQCGGTQGEGTSVRCILSVSSLVRSINLILIASHESSHCNEERQLYHVVLMNYRNDYEYIQKMSIIKQQRVRFIMTNFLFCLQLSEISDIPLEQLEFAKVCEKQRLAQILHAFFCLSFIHTFPFLRVN